MVKCACGDYKCNTTAHFEAIWEPGKAGLFVDGKGDSILVYLDPSDLEKLIAEAQKVLAQIKTQPAA